MPTHYYVDPALNDNSGSGTIGDPYGDLQYALDQLTLGSGLTQINVKSGVAEVLAAPLTLNGAYNLLLRVVGFDNVADDGGEAEIQCDGNPFFASNAYAKASFANFKISGFGNSQLRPGVYCNFDDCEIFGYTGSSWFIQTSVYSDFLRCRIHSFSGAGCLAQNFRDCVFFNFTANKALRLSVNQSCQGSVFLLPSNAIALDGNGGNTAILGNTFISDGGAECIYFASGSPNILENTTIGSTNGIRLFQNVELAKIANNLRLTNSDFVNSSVDSAVEIGTQTLTDNPFVDPFNLDFRLTDEAMKLPLAKLSAIRVYGKPGLTTDPLSGLLDTSGSNYSPFKSPAVFGGQ